MIRILSALFLMAVITDAGFCMERKHVTGSAYPPLTRGAEGPTPAVNTTGATGVKKESKIVSVNRDPTTIPKWSNWKILDAMHNLAIGLTSGRWRNPPTAGDNDKVGIIFLGGTGSGKTSLIDAFFSALGLEVKNKDDLKVSDTCLPGTKEITTYAFEDVAIIHDSPGLGDAPETDKCTVGCINSHLEAVNEKGIYAEIDCVVLVLDGNSRDLSAVNTIIESLLNIRKVEKDRVLVVMNQIDVFCKNVYQPDLYWNEGTCCPTDRGKKEITLRIGQLHSGRLADNAENGEAKGLGIDRENIIAVAARAGKKIGETYNLPLFVAKINTFLAKGKRTVLLKWYSPTLHVKLSEQFVKECAQNPQEAALMALTGLEAAAAVVVGIRRQL